MDRFITQENTRSLKPVVKPVSIGGLNADSVETASQTLNSVEISEVGQPMSCVPLGTNSVVPEEFIATELVKAGDCVTGNFSLYTREIGHFFITNYDCQRPYVVTAPDANIELVSHANPVDALEPGTLIYTAPTILGSVSGSLHFTVNDKVYPVTIDNSYVEKPSITYPANDAIVTTQVASFTVSPFNNFGGPQTQTLLQFQASNTPVFSGTLRNSGSTANPADNSFTLSLNTDGEEIYVRARYIGTYGQPSDWSDPIKITASLINWPTTETIILHSDDATPQEWFGTRVAMNQTGDRVLVGAIYDDLGAINATGAAYVFRKDGAVWSQEAKLVSSDTSTIKEFGNSIDLSADGTVAVVGCYDEQISGGYHGVVYVFRRTDTTWIFETKLIASDVTLCYQFGNNVAISPDGNYIVVSDIYRHNGGDNYNGKVYIYHYNGSSWIETILQTPDNVSGFGTSLSFDGNASRLVIGSISNYTGATEEVPVSIFLRSGITWTEESTIRVLESTGADWSMTPVDINSNGDLLVFGTQSSNSPSTDAGAVYVFTRTGSVWTQQARIVSPTPIAYSKFGSSLALNQAGDILLIGQPYTVYQGSVYPGLNITEAGIAYVFVRNGVSWVFKKLLSVAFPTPSSWFGISCDLDGSGQYAIIGAMKGSIDTNENHEGVAYIFT